MVQEDLSMLQNNQSPDTEESWWKEALMEGESREHEEGQVSVFSPSSRPASVDLDVFDHPENNWERIQQLYKQDEVVELKVVGCNQGGLLVQGEDINGFIPCSHLLNGAKKQNYLQKTILLKIIEFDQDRCRVVLSERAAQAGPGKRLKLLDSLEEGSCFPGKVTTITDFGAFVDLGGMEGLIHISELSWGRVDHPSDVVSVGDELEVFVLNVDKEQNKVALSLKKLCRNPWETIQERYQTGQVVQAVVKSIVSYGAFVQLEEGVDGLIHVSELGDNGGQVSPWEILSEDEVVSVEIIHLDPSEQRLGLSLEMGE
jgi:small subunit ribosomal protein S1